MPPKEANLKRALKCREVYINFFDTLENYIKKDSLESATISHLKTYNSGLSEYYREFLKVQTVIEDLDDSEIDSNIRVEMDRKYFEFKPRLEDKLSQLQDVKKNISTTGPSGVSEELSFVPKLPELKIDIFEGSPDKWKVFIESFNNHIHNNKRLNDLTKFQYLRNLTKGEGAKPIESVEFTSENYVEARKLLIERFDRPNLITEHHLRCLFSLKKIEKPNSSNMLSLLDEFNSHLRSLKSLGRPTEFWDDLIVYLMVTKLDTDSKSKWRDFTPSDRMPTFHDMSEFLKSRSFKLQEFKINASDSSSSQSKSNNAIKPSQSRSSFQSSKAYHCIFCNKEGHSIMRCHQFAALSIPDRRSAVEKLKICFNCLRSSHFANKCPNQDKCHVCRSKHHTLLHLDQSSQSNTAVSQPSSSSSSINQDHVSATAQASQPPQNSNSLNSITSAHSSNSFNCLSRRSNYVLLATAVVEVIDKFGTPVQARALLDSGSQINFMTESFASRVGIKSFKSSLSIRGIGCSSSSSSRSAFIRLRSRVSNFSSQIEVYLLPKITDNQPAMFIERSKLIIPANIRLADPNFFEPRKIDLLLGAEIFFELQAVGQVKLGDDLPFLQNTILGWVVSGKVDCTSKAPPNVSLCNLVSNCTVSENVEFLLERFWELDNTDTSDNNNETFFESECDKHFRKTYSRNIKGQFVVNLPFSSRPTELGDSGVLAHKRFLNLERRLNKNMELRSSYNAFMSEYLSLGHMELELSVKDLNYYLPHHCVIKPDSSSTRLRVVFDGSAKSSSGKSLNDLLMSGPVVQRELFAILLRFRSHAFAISADVAKMYRQVLMHDDDQSFQYILWRFSEDDQIQTYKLKTVTYGTTSAPFLATRCLLQLALESNEQFPAASSTIRNDFYVDDMLTGANTLEDAISLKSSVTHILQQAGMPLRKWCANDSRILHDVSDSDREPLIKIDDDHQVVKTLGLFWESNRDNFQLVVSPCNSSRVTKRLVISEIAKIFDPMGLVCPIVVYGKLFMQQLWQLKVDWDSSLPMQYHTKWCNFRNELPKLSNFSVPRHIFNNCSTPTRIQLHGFADASEKAFGAVFYVRAYTLDEICVRLLCSKSRVAPLKRVTLPRLELCAAQLLANLLMKIKELINYEVVGVYLWSDSTIALSWIKSPSSKWKTYVANRISDIQSKSDINNWHHVESKLNPADVISRGALPDDLLTSNLWWYGPPFLQCSDEFWLQTWKPKTPAVDMPEQRKLITVLTAETNLRNEILSHLLERMSSYEKLIRIVSYIIKLFKRPQTPTLVLSSDEFLQGTNMIVKWIQMECFPDLVHGLQNPNYLVKDPSLKSLSLFLDSNRVIRVGGRLQFSSLSYQSKHPALLPKSHDFNLIMFHFFHRKHLHVGPQGLLAVVRQQFWPINGRQLAKRVCRNCILCSRVRPRLLQQQMASLPPERVTIAPPFYNVGVDYAGPFYVHFRIRGKSPMKTYLAVFVCLSTKAIHLELASDMSSASFIGCFRRFVATRGLCKRIFSDNGTNFVGANSHLNEMYNLLHDSKLQSDLSALFRHDQIEWNFMPAGSPHFGGIYEAAVKSAKYHLRRIMGVAALTYEELNTLIKQVEAILNSRPLTPLSSENELDVLTPGHFLIGRPLTAVPELNLPDDRNVNRLSRWELVSHLYKSFWSRWSKEYLQQLQHRYYWQDKQRNIPMGSIVIVKDDNQPPLKWKMGRVITLHPGPDGLVRVVTLKTATGIIQRAISKLSPLPIDVEPESVQEGENEQERAFTNI